MNITVTKRDGVIEDYDPIKIVNVAVAAGLDKEKAGLLAAEITDWVKKSGLHEFTSLQLRDLVISKLHKYDESVAKMFMWYQSTKK